MDPNTRAQRGTGGKRLVASSYLLELVPGAQGAENRRHRNHHSDSVFQLPFRGEENLSHGQQDFPPLSQHGWAGGRLEERLPIPAAAKRRLSHTKRRSLSSDQGLGTPAVISEPTTIHNNIIFTESPANPGVPIIYRPPEEKSVNPDRLNLDRRHLTVCPMLEGEERLRLLNLQHNSITKLQHLSGLRRLVFLDLYDNLVQDMGGLEELLSLRVLMLGKNRIRKITGLHTLMRLDVLDLHGNMIREVENLCHLAHLRVLNLAGNEIACVSGLAGLNALAELNFRRNRITHVFDIDQLPSLQRLFLSHNLIQSFTDISCLSQCPSLAELTLDGNPLSNCLDHRHSIISHLHCLKSLDQLPILDQEREEAMASLREEEEKLKEQRRKTVVQEYREAAIVAIQKSWDASHTDLGLSTITQSSYDLTSHSTKRRHPLTASASLPHLLPTCLVDMTPPTLHLYGSGALDALDTPPQDTKPVTALHFHCIEFSEVVSWLGKIPRAFPDLNSVCFECTNLTTLDQINFLSSLPSPLLSLTITPHGNPLTSHPLFTHYTLYRLQHLQLSTFNEKEITKEDLTAASRVFHCLGKLSTTQLQPARLASFVLHHRPKSIHRGSKVVPQNDKRQAEEPLDRVGLHSPTGLNDKAQETRKAAACSVSNDLHSATLEAHQKLAVIQTQWPDILTSLVHSALREYSHLDSTMSHLLDNL